MKKCSLIYNPIATGFNRKELDTICKLISDRGYTLELLESNYAGHVIELVKEANNSDLTISMGGDGTVRDAIMGYQNIVQKSLYSHISTGTTNDIASNFRLLKKDPIESTKLILDGKEQGFDIVRVNGEAFAYVSCFGYLAKVPYETSLKMKRIFGKGGYVIRAFTHDLLHKPINYRISYTIDGKKQTTSCLFGAVSNSKGFGGINIYPMAEIDDGVFEVLFLNELNLKGLCSLIIDYFKGGVDLSKYSNILTHMVTDNIKIEFEDQIPVDPIDNDGDRANFFLDANNNCLDYHYDGKVKMLLPSKRR